jgi:hypothetical protein
MRRPEDQSLLLSAFLQTGGAALSGVAKDSRLHTHCPDFDWAPTSLDLSARQMDAAVEDLKRLGYHLLPVRVPDRVVSNLAEECILAQCTVRTDDPRLNGVRAGVSLDGGHLGERYEVDSRAIVNSEAAASLFLDRGLLGIAQAYLGGAPVLDIATAWFSFPTDSPSEEAAQMFHFDLDRVRWLKIFFYLTDVSTLNGPHVFVSGSHRDRAIPRRLLRRGYTRLADEVVAEAFPAESWLTATGSAGLILLEDTRGLHKGAHLAEGYRLLAQVQYSLSTFGGPSSLPTDVLAGSRLEGMIPEEHRPLLLPTAAS